MRNDPVEFTAARDELESDQYRYLQGAAVVELFRRSHGRDPVSFEDLAAWAHDWQPERIDPFDVLTREQIAAALAQFKTEPRPKGGA